MKIRAFINNVIRKDGSESTKRIVSLFSMLLVSYVVIRFTNYENIVSVLMSLLGFVLSLLGVAVWEDIAKHKIDSEKNKGQN